MKNVAILQARYSSTRLPGKVLKPIVGKPMLLLQLERIKRARLIDQVIVATSSDKSDDVLYETLTAAGYTCFRGDLNNVLARFFHALSMVSYRPDNVVRLTGDCPLIDPEIIDQIISAHMASGADYTSNSVQPTYPDGLDVEVMTMAALETAFKEAELPSHTEHVTPFIHQNPTRFKVNHFKNPEGDFSALRWTVDEPSDFELVKNIYENFYTNRPAFTTKDVLTFLSERPDLVGLNSSFTRNEGLLKSYKQDAEYLKEKR